MRRFIAFLMSAVLAIGLMPIVPYGESFRSAWADDVVAAVAPLGEQGHVELVGLQLNEEPISLNTWNYPPDAMRFGVLPSYIEAGGVGLAFEGSVAPRLVVARADGSSLATIHSKGATSLVWEDAEHTGGVEFFSAETIAAAIDPEKGALADVRRVWPQADSAPVTVGRIVLTGVDPLPDVSDGNYGKAPVRRVYTRPVSLVTGLDSGDRVYRTTAIDVFNPVFDGADFAVRYTCPEGKEATPYLQLCHVTPDDRWIGWTSMNATWGARTAVDAETGERVTFFRRAELERLWSERGGKDGDAYDHLFVGVHVQDSNHPAGSEQCDLVEVVALGGVDRVELTDGQLHKVSGLSAAEITRNMRAGYNMAGHFESNFVPDSSKDGGWSQSDLALETHWASGTYITRETIRGLKESGFNTVRLPVTWFQHIYPAGDPTGKSADHPELKPVERYHIDRAWLERVHEVVDWCIAEDLYVIVNMHHEDWIDRQDLGTAYDDSSADLPAKFKAVWTQIADEFAGYDQRLVFEDMNEPHEWYYETDEDGTYKLDAEGKRVVNWGYASEGSVATVNRLNADFVKLMREELDGHGQRLLMLAHDTGNGEIAYTGFKMPEDEAGLLAHSIHCYTPHDWTHYLMKAPAGETGKDNVYTAQYRRDVEAQWELIRSRYTARGEAVVLGEFGCFYQYDPDDPDRTAALQQDRLDWMTQYATHAKELGIPLVYWRMDRSTTDENGKSHQLWSAFDEETHELSPLSKHLFDKWFDILGDEAVEWGSLALVDEGEHVAIDGEDARLIAPSDGWPRTISGLRRSESNDWYAAMSGLKWADIDGCEIAVKYTGSTPRLGAVQEDYGGDYWGMSPDVVDYDRGIAYWRASSIATRWSAVVAANEASAAPDSRLLGSTVENITRLYVVTATSGANPPTELDQTISTTIEQVAILHQHDWAVGYTRDKAPTYTSEGSESIHCARCGAIKPGSERPVAKLAQTSLSGAKIVLKRNGATVKNNTVTFNGKAQKPAVAVTYGKETLKEGTHYSLSFLRGSSKTGDFKNAGKITVKVTATSGGKFKDSKTATFTIGKASQSIAAKKSVAKSFKGKRGALATTKTFSLKSLGKVSAKTTVAYAQTNAKGGKLIAVSKKGVVTVKKGLAKGLYAVTVKLTAPAGTNYKAASAKTITVNVRVK